MLDDANKLQLLFEILDELSSAKGHRDHYKDLYEETKRGMSIRLRQLNTAVILLKQREYDAGVMGVCGFCGYKPHHSSCAMGDLLKDIDFSNEYGIEGYAVDNTTRTG